MNTWDEKNYTKPKSNCLNNNEQEPSDTTKITKSDSTQSQWIDIGGVKKWIRHCPECGVEILTKTKQLALYTRKCMSCSHKHQKRARKVYTDVELSRECPKCSNTILHTTLKNCNAAKKKNIVCRACKDSGQLIGENKPCKNCNKLFYVSVGQARAGYGMFCSRSCSAIYHKEDTRNRMIRTMQEKPGQIYPNYNPNACKFIDIIGKKLGYNFRHAENGGEIFIDGVCCWVDGYDVEKNVIIEYDEPYHYDRKGKLKQKDIDRMNKIIQHTNCKFYRYNERTKEFYECKSNFNSTTIV